AARRIGPGMPGHDACQVGAVQERDGRSEQPGGGGDAGGRVVECPVRAGAELADMAVDRGREGRGLQGPAEGPGCAEQRGDHPDIAEGPGSGPGGLPVVKEAEQAPLFIQYAPTGGGWLVSPGD